LYFSPHCNFEHNTVERHEFNCGIVADDKYRDSLMKVCFRR
jgi:hypothetical protein